MSYKKFFKAVSTAPKMGNTENTTPDVMTKYSKLSNYLPIVYQGPQSRVERYTIYDGMEQDPNISYSLDTLAEYITQTSEDPFKIEYDSKTELPANHTTSLEKCLDIWVGENSWKKRLFNIVREVLKYGDVFFIKDPETNILNKCNIYDVIGVVCDEYKKPIYYIIRNVDLNVPLSIANNSKNDIATKNLITTLNSSLPNSVNNTTQQITTTDPNGDMSMLPVDAKNVVHLSLNVDNILTYPFGISTLEAIFKTYMQKMVLQDCILLHRIKNAVDKTVFTIPVGGMPRHKIAQYMEQCKNEMSQRRMPSKDSNGVFNTVDVAYNSIPQTEDYWIPVTADGVQPKIEKLQSSGNLGEINDLVYWENQLIRGLKVPQSWVPYGPQDGQRNLPTASAGTYVQEQRFFNYCKRIQNVLIEDLDAEFKKFVNKSGIKIDTDAYSLSFYPPSTITDITETQMLNERLQVCSTALQNPYLSKQFVLKHYLKLTEEEFNENQELLLLELQNTLKNKNVDLPTEDSSKIPGLRSVSVDEIPLDYLNSAEADMSGSAGMGLGGEPFGGEPLSGEPMGGEASMGVEGNVGLSGEPAAGAMGGNEGGM